MWEYRALRQKSERFIKMVPTVIKKCLFYGVKIKSCPKLICTQNPGHIFIS